MVSTTTLGGRVRGRREELGWSEQALADRTGLSKMQVHRIETGVRKKLSAGELAVLREALDLPLEELIGSTRRPSQLSSLAARVAREDATAEFSTALGRAGQIIALMDRVPRRAEPQVTAWWDIPQGGLEKDRGALLAMQVRSALGLADDEPVADLPLVCERDFGLAVSLEPLPKGLRGLAVSLADAEGYEPDRALALVDTSRQERGAQRFTAAHELAHVLFGDFDGQLVRIDTEGSGGQSAATRYMETKADAFAAEFLAPRSAVQRMLADVRSADDDAFLTAVAFMALHFGISWKAAGIRASEGDPVHSYDWFRRHARDRTLARLGLAERWTQQDVAGEVEPPPLLLRAALATLQRGEGDVTIFDVAALYRTMDIKALNAALVASGWLDADAASA